MATGCPLLDSEFVARQNGKLLPCARLVVENEELRDEFRKMDVWHSKELLAAIDENKKLRELINVMAYCMQQGRDCDGCATNGADGVVTAPSGCDWLRDRMREMGVVE